MAEPDKYKKLLHRTLISQVLIALILVVSALGFAVLSAQKPDVATRDVDVKTLNVDTFHVARVTFREILTAYGTARPDRQVVVAAQVSGEIVEVHPQLEVGQAVSAEAFIVSAEHASRRRPGDALVQLDERDYSNRVRQAQNRINESLQEIEQLQQQAVNNERLLEKAKKDIVTFDAEFQRAKKAFQMKAGTETALSRALMELQRQQDAIFQLENQISLSPHQLASAKERLATGRSEYDRATDDLQRTRVVPPFDGVLSEIMAEEGQFVRVGEALFRLTDPGVIEVPVSIGLEDWHQVSASLSGGHVPDVSLATSESSEARWTGRIARVAPEADPGSRTIQAFVEVQNSEQNRELLPGTFLHARITGTAQADAVVIPREAIFNEHVFVVGEDRLIERRPVRQGRRLKSLVMITEGLDGGEQIATTNLSILQDGREVDVQEKSSLTVELESQASPLLQIVDTNSTESAAAEAAALKAVNGTLAQ